MMFVTDKDGKSNEAYPVYGVRSDTAIWGTELFIYKEGCWMWVNPDDYIPCNVMLSDEYIQDTFNKIVKMSQQQEVHITDFSR